MSESYTQEIESYYTESLRDYEIVWQLKHSMALHYGFWDEQVNSHRQALWHMNFQIAKNAQIRKTDVVLDAGCGVGGTSFFLANNIGCAVEGISLSQGHINRALEYKKDNDPKDLVRFSCQNYCNTTFPDNHFDVIFCVESVVNAENKTEFLKEAYRILKPEGRLLISDYFIVKQPKDDREKSTLKKWANSWAIPHFINENDFINEVKTIGFKSYLLKDFSENVYPSIKLMHRSYYPGVFISVISNFFGRRTNKQLNNSKSGKYQYQLYKSGVWRYKQLLVFKSSNEHYKSFEDFIKDEKPCEMYIDNEPLKERFPIRSQNGFSGRNVFKRIMHHYLETGIKNPQKSF